MARPVKNPIIDGKKTCSKCKENKPVTEFRRTRKDSTDLQTYCKECMKNYNRVWWNKTYQPDPVRRRNKSLKQKYGINQEIFDRMLEEQSGKCAICSTTEPGGFGNIWHVDHCHTSNKLRGLLCQKCNQGLGLFRDNTDFLTKAIGYLVKHG